MIGKPGEEGFEIINYWKRGNVTGIYPQFASDRNTED
jgi:hypothetical protein